MNTNENNKLLFANENTIFRIVTAARIVSWVMLVILLVFFLNDLIGMAQASLPTEFSQLILTLANLFYTPALGVFYFLILQGVAHGLNLGLDIYYDFQPEEDEEEADEEA